MQLGFREQASEKCPHGSRIDEAAYHSVSRVDGDDGIGRGEGADESCEVVPSGWVETGTSWNESDRSSCSANG